MLTRLFYSFLSIVFVSSYQIVALLLTTPLASSEELGLLTLLMTVNAFLFLFVDFGLSNYLIHKKNLNETSVRRLKRINFFLGCVVFVLSLFIASVMFILNVKSIYIFSIVLTSLNCLFLSLSRIDRARFQMHGDFKSIFKVDLYSRIAGIIILYALLFLDQNVVGSYLCSTIAVNILAKFIINRVLKRKHMTYGDVQNSDLLKFCIPQFLNSILNFSTQNIDLIIVTMWAGLEVGGVYGVIKIISNKPMNLYMPTLMKVYTPIIATTTEFERDLGQLYAKVIAISFITYLAILFLAPYILITFFKISDSNAIAALQLFSIYMYLRAISMPIGAIIIRTGAVTKGLYFSVFQVLTLPLMLLYILPTDFPNLIKAMVLYQLTISFLLWFLFIRKEYSYNSIFEYFGALLPALALVFVYSLSVNI